MNKWFLTIFASGVLLSLSAVALEPISSTGQVFGIPDGTYEGTGKLESDSIFVPDLNFDSVRTLKNGIITAKTNADLIGLIDVAEAQARLQVVPTGPGQFDMLDLDANGAKAGSGQCASNRCSFKVTVMNGDLTLDETWIPTADGFEVLEARQVYKGISASYSGVFIPKP